MGYAVTLLGVHIITVTYAAPPAIIAISVPAYVLDGWKKRENHIGAHIKMQMPYVTLSFTRPNVPSPADEIRPNVPSSADEIRPNVPSPADEIRPNASSPADEI